MTDWPHAPVHRLDEQGAYIVTAGTYGKAHFFRGDERLSLLQDSLLDVAKRQGWHLQAWAVFSNHYHFVTTPDATASPLRELIRSLHSLTVRGVNRLDASPGRRVWLQFWDSRLTFERSYFARLHYVHQNPVRHGLVPVATAYLWCSAAWFEREAPPSLYNTVSSFKTDRLAVHDEFDPPIR